MGTQVLVVSESPDSLSSQRRPRRDIRPRLPQRRTRHGLAEPTGNPVVMETARRESASWLQAEQRMIVDWLTDLLFDSELDHSGTVVLPDGTDCIIPETARRLADALSSAAPGNRDRILSDVCDFRHAIERQDLAWHADDFAWPQ